MIVLHSSEFIVLAVALARIVSHVSHQTFSRNYMASLSYEVALFGEFFSQDLKAILNRITLHSESSQPFRSGEIVFEPIDAQSQRDTGVEPILLRAKKDFSEGDTPWYIHVSIPSHLLSLTIRQGSCLATSNRSLFAFILKRQSGHGLHVK